MAEWVQKGNLKGPQGDPGQDAQLPAGGTEGQVLTKTSGGEAWQDVPEPDLTGVVKYADGNLVADGSAATQIIASENIPNAYSFIKGSGTTASVAAASGSRVISMSADGSSVEFSMGSKSVTSITDAISDSPTGNALVTDKAVADYVTANAPSVTLPLPVSQGGTGATTADGARTALGISVADPDELVEYIKSKLGV